MAEGLSHLSQQIESMRVENQGAQRLPNSLPSMEQNSTNVSTSGPDYLLKRLFNKGSVNTSANSPSTQVSSTYASNSGRIGTYNTASKYSSSVTSIKTPPPEPTTSQVRNEPPLAGHEFADTLIALDGDTPGMFSTTAFFDRDPPIIPSDIYNPDEHWTLVSRCAPQPHRRALRYEEHESFEPDPWSILDYQP